MSTDFFVSDTHFYHGNSLKFLRADGVTRMRPEFETVEEMNEHMVDRWNSVVGRKDTIYHLGDFAMGTSAWVFKILDRMNGRKILLKGNHDKARPSIYLRYFHDVRGSMNRKTPGGVKVIFTHYPVHPTSLYKAVNVHGHIHEKTIPDDPRYINVSVERTDYTPIPWHDLVARIDYEISPCTGTRQ